jgi:hypothetical protein
MNLLELILGQKHLPQDGLRVSVGALPEFPPAACGNTQRPLVPWERAAGGAVGQVPRDQRRVADGRAHLAEPDS